MFRATVLLATLAASASLSVAASGACSTSWGAGKNGVWTDATQWAGGAPDDAVASFPCAAEPYTVELSAPDACDGASVSIRGLELSGEPGVILSLSAGDSLEIFGCEDDDGAFGGVASDGPVPVCKQSGVVTDDAVQTSVPASGNETGGDATPTGGDKDEATTAPTGDATTVGTKAASADSDSSGAIIGVVIAIILVAGLGFVFFMVYKRRAGADSEVKSRAAGVNNASYEANNDASLYSNDAGGTVYTNGVTEAGSANTYATADDTYEPGQYEPVDTSRMPDSTQA